MEKDLENLSQPLTPNSIPNAVINESQDPGIQRRINNPLDFSPQSSFFRFIKIPALIFFNILIAYLLGRYKFNFLFILALCHIVYFVFKRRVDKYILSLDVLSREKARKDNLSDFETVEWLNYIVRKFWEVSEASVSSQIYSQVNAELKKNTPKVLKSLKLTELTLGTRPPVVERIGFISSNEDCIIIEFATNFIPIQTSEDLLAYFEPEKKHWNTCIELTATVGFVKLPILVRNFTFSGIFKVTIDLTRKIPFLKQLTLSMLEVPLIDFELQPLKTVDFMDIPYLSKFIHSIMNKVIASQLVSPNSIIVNLENIADYKGKTIGVIYVYVKNLHTNDSSSSWIEVTNNGSCIGKTAVRSGGNPVFNEGFYDIISDTTKYIGITAHTNSTTYNGKIHMRNLNKFTYYDKVYLSNEESRRFANMSAHFFKKTDRRTASAIINMNVISIRDLQALNDPKSKLYSTYCLIEIETKEIIKNRIVLKEFETKRIFSSKDPFYNEQLRFFVRNFHDYIIKIKVMNEKDDSVIGNVSLTLNEIQDESSNFYKIGGVETGDLEVKFEMEYIDLESVDTSCVEGVSECTIKQEADFIKKELEDSSGTIDTLVSIENESKHTESNKFKRRKNKSIPGIPGACKLKPRGFKKVIKEDKIIERPTVELMNLGIYKEKKHENKILNYSKVYKYSLKKIFQSGIYYLVFETDHLNCKMEAFSTEIDIDRSVIVPIVNEKFIRIRLFSMSINGEVLVSEEIMALDENVVVFDRIRVEFEKEEKYLEEITGTDSSDSVKIIQFKLEEISHPGNYTIDVITDKEIRSEKVIQRIQTIEIGSKDLYCILKDNNKVISKFSVPKRNMRESFKLNRDLSCLLTVNLKKCNFDKLYLYSQGELEIHIIKGASLTLPNGNQFVPFVKVYLNDEKIFKTQKKNKSIDPMFNESLKVEIQREIDVLTFHIGDYTSMASDKILFCKEFSLFNLNEGYSKFDLNLNEGSSNELSNAILQVIFNFKPFTDLNLGSSINKENE